MIYFRPLKEKKKRKEEEGAKNINHPWIETADFMNQKVENQAI